MQNKNIYLPINKKNNRDFYDGDKSPYLKIAKLWSRYIPRGKGWFPRIIGKLFGESLQRNYIRTKQNAYLVIDPRSLDIYAHMLNHGRTWNEPVLETCKKFLKEGEVFYDLGANIGYISIELAQLFSDQVNVIAFEPQPYLADAIALSTKLNKFENVKVFDVMVGDHCGNGNLYVGSHSIHASAVARESNSSYIKRDVATIDELIKTGSIPPPKVIKMDIEGGELNAIKGAKWAIFSYQPYIVFESDENMGRFGYRREELLELIKSFAKYDFYFIGGLDGPLIELSHENMAFNYSDIIGIPTSCKLKLNA